METTMVNNIEGFERVLDNFRTKSVYLWIHGSFTAPLLLFEDFQWDYEEVDDVEYLIFYSGENRFVTQIEEIFDIKPDEFTGELIIWMDNQMVLQMWTELE